VQLVFLVIEGDERLEVGQRLLGEQVRTRGGAVAVSAKSGGWPNTSRAASM